MKKKGVSTVVAVVLSVLLVMGVASMLFFIVRNTVRASVQEAEDEMTCLQEVDLSVVDSCYKNYPDGAEEEGEPKLDYIEFTLKNNRPFDYETKFFVIRVSRSGNSQFVVPTNMPETLKSLEQKKFVAVVDKPQELEDIVLIPKIKEDGGYCLGKKVEFMLEREC